jgi:hypothetical protein
MGGRTRLRPVGAEVGANRRWVDHDIASLAEGLFGEQLDPTALDDAARAAVAARLPPGWRLARVEPDEDRWTRWWVEDEGVLAGTIALQPPWGGFFTRVASVYTQPGARGRGAAARALDLAQDVALLTGSDGIVLDTEWTWFLPARFYLRHGFWVRSWKHALTLQRGPYLPAHTIDIAGDAAVFSVARDGASVPLLRATRRGDRLEWAETDAFAGEGEATYAAPPTFALALALAGWPLYRSAEAWARSASEFDVGGPEALSRRIELFEALARRDGLAIKAPRVPGIRYRDMEEIG